eukprot:14498853-Alexandrium_andersonii.AAC.1
MTRLGGGVSRGLAPIHRKNWRREVSRSRGTGLPLKRSMPSCATAACAVMRMAGAPRLRAL